MKTISFLLALSVFLCLGFTINAQQPFYPKPNTDFQLVFGKKLPPPVLNANESKTKIYYKMKGLPFNSPDALTKQSVLNMPGYKNPSNPLSHNKGNAPLMSNSLAVSSHDFHVIDINSNLAGS